MLRISKITDYGIVLLTELARGAPGELHAARELSETAQLPLPVVSKTLKALTRRGLGTASNLLKHGPLTFDATGRVAYLNDQMVELSARELSLLEVLLQRTGRLVSKDQLVERLCEWGEEVSNNAIEVYIHRLRKKIEQGPVRIATVRGLGYCLEKINS